MRRAEPPPAHITVIIGNTRVIICKAVRAVFRFLRRQEKYFIIVQDIFGSKIPIICTAGKPTITFRSFQNRIKFGIGEGVGHAASFNSCKIFAPRLCVAALPCVHNLAICMIAIMLFAFIIYAYARGIMIVLLKVYVCSQQFFRQQEQPVVPGIGLIVQHPPLNRIAVPCAVIDIVISICAVIAADTACVKLNRLVGICRKGRCRDQRKRHAQTQQDRLPSFLHSHVVSSSFTLVSACVGFAPERMFSLWHTPSREPGLTKIDAGAAVNTPWIIAVSASVLNSQQEGVCRVFDEADVILRIFWERSSQCMGISRAVPSISYRLTFSIFLSPFLFFTARAKRCAGIVDAHAANTPLSESAG